MSIRIHELAKKIGMDNKELLALLKERHFDVKSVSSTIDNISADALVEELKQPEPATAAPVVEQAEPKAETTPAKSKVSQVNLPAGAFVKSVGDIAREKAVKSLEDNKPVAPKPIKSVPPPPPMPAAPKAPARPVSAPVPLPPTPVAKAAPPAPPPLPRASTGPSAPPVPMVSSGPRPTPVIATAEKPEVTGDIKVIQIKPPIIVRDFAVELGMKPFKLISELNQAGGFASMNSTIEEAVAIAVAEKHGFILEIKHRGEAAAQLAAAQEEKQQADPAVEEEKNLEPRPPVVCILGHVDHGKTSLLDSIRKTKVVAGEAGGITQHIGAYQIERSGRLITFLDTPGHAAFTKMRARGANVTDIAVLVVAADDGFMPQTDEALKHAQTAGVSLIVAVNKMDVKGANLDQVKTQMQQRNIAPEDWGGETITVPVSALKGEGVDTLLEMILLQADLLELKANPKAEASGIIVESEIDFGRGPMATVIIDRGTLRVGDAIVSGPYYAKVRAMYDELGQNIKSAPPSTPVRVIGWSGTPESGASFKAVKSMRVAEAIAEEEELRLKQLVTRAAAAPKEVSVEQLFANIAATQAKTLKVILKTDVYGSAEAVRNILEGIQSTKVSLEILASEVGLVTKNDVLMASASDAMIIGFHTKLENGVTPLAKHHGVRIATFDIIYELGDKVRETLADMLDPDLKEIKLGVAEVRQVFPLAKGFVAGCLVTEGKITRNAQARLRRKKDTIHEGKIGTLKRFKDDANEVRAGLECGIKLDEFNAYEAGDVIECYEVQKVRASL
ncbi:MAG: translation initiation factor IF-2 [Cephaloticoccus sp.]|nr:translation initiation factor IF-2 [Cephaloticoccus sp.]MCF7760807.1 translation initiation factor IF-2 [Cephaloticoccus sp.]